MRSVRFAMWIGFSAAGCAAEPTERVVGLVSGARSALIAGDFERMERSLAEAVTIAARPEDVKVLADFDEERGFSARAVERYEAALPSARPDAIPALSMMKGGLLRYGEDLLGAIEAFEEALVRAEENPSLRRAHRRQILLELADLYEQTGRLQAAEDAIRRHTGIRDRGEYLNTYPAVGRNCWTGLEIFASGMPVFVNQLAEFFTRYGRVAEAEAELRRSATERGGSAQDLENFATPLLTLLHWLEQQGRTAEARVVFDELFASLLTAAPTDLAASVNLGLTLGSRASARRDYARAARIYEIILDRDTGSQRRRDHIAREVAAALEKLGQKDLASAVRPPPVMRQFGKPAEPAAGEPAPSIPRTREEREAHEPAQVLRFPHGHDLAKYERIATRYAGRRAPLLIARARERAARDSKNAEQLREALRGQLTAIEMLQGPASRKGKEVRDEIASLGK